jgi:hypothetical protein
VARSIIGVAILPLKGLTDQAELDAETQQGEPLAVVLTRMALAAASPHLYVSASAEPADRDLVWRRTDSVVVDL